ncbi:hypothetical protein [Gilvimarinus algae]|uniref:Uncharacterized protein n=1 Tax=Gilvimarinus algae TaxID=3058037 RepID=A0ABT8TBD9_9GAMM|nr:hypothetical protein [Gilvimarinus sp. SDUM040014]MDO3381424.1 hypothetical protein [Gilvimarinus sp. SDUM040014]
MKVLGCLVLLCLAATSRADGLADLQRALETLTQRLPVTGELAVEVMQKYGDGDDAVERKGAASARVVDSPEALSLAYGAELLASLEGEEAQRARDPDVATPAKDGVHELSPADARLMVRARDSLQRSINAAQYLGETEESYEQVPARRLDFALPISQLAKHERKYVKSYDGVLSVWIDENGVPLASRTRIDASGRVFIFIRFHFEVRSDRQFVVHGDRLLALEDRYYQQSRGAGERSERRVHKTLRVSEGRDSHSH